MGARTGNPSWQNRPATVSPLAAVPLQNIEDALDASAPIDSPEFIGMPTAPTPAAGDISHRLATTEFVSEALGSGSVPTQVLTRAAYNALETPDPGTLYLIEDAAGAMGSFRKQGTLQYPAAYSAFTVGTTVYLVDYGTSTLIRIINTWHQQITLTGVDSLTVMSAAVDTATNQIILTGYSASNVAQVYFVDLSTFAVTAVDIPATGSTHPFFGAGARASDGKVYFATRDATINGPLVVDPVAKTATIQTFGSTWVKDVYGIARVGGDGKVYFLPGNITPAGGSYNNGQHWAALDPTTQVLTVTTLAAGSEFAAVDGAAAPTGLYVFDGVFSKVYKITSSGLVLLADLQEVLGYGLGSNRPVAKMSGGKIAMLTSNTDAYSNMDIPAVVLLDPATDTFSLYGIPELAVNGVPVIPCSTAVDYWDKLMAYMINPTVNLSNVPPGYPDFLTCVLTGPSFGLALGATPLRGTP